MKQWQKVALALGFGAAAFKLAESTAQAKETPSGGLLPKGKGIFIQGLVAKGQDPAHLLERLKYLGMQWVAIEIAWFGPPGPSWTHGPDGVSHNLEDGALAAFVPELVAAGIQVWVWGFPSPDRQAAFVQYTKDAYAAAPQVAGVIIDPEKPYYGTTASPNQYAAELEDLVAKLQGLGRPVGATSYGFTNFHPQFPWQSLSKVEFGMPQLYSDDIGADYPAKGDDSWRALGIDYIVPLNGAYGKEHTPAEMATQAQLSDTSNGAIGWWNYALLVLDMGWDQPGRVQAVRDFSSWGGDG